MFKCIVVLLSLFALGACSSGRYELKSPCVAADIGGTEDFPCGPRKRVNDEWLKLKG